MDAKVVGRKIAELRKKRNMTQRELALALNVIDKTISRWECGYGLPDLTIIPELATILGVGIEDIIGDGPTEKPIAVASYSDVSAKYDNVVVLRHSRRNIIIIICAVVAAIAVTLGIVLPLALNKPAPEPERTITHSCWFNVASTDADVAFITAFGYDECMSLELWGDDVGTFVCQESWKVSKNSNLLECAVYGRYLITGERIEFYADRLIDPSKTEKLRLNTPLGVECFYAGVEYGNDGTVEAIVFTANEKDGPTSAFGRWTKFANYFSRVESEIYFERVTDGLTVEQCMRLPEFVSTELGVTLPYNLTLSLDRYDYYVGEVINAEDLTVNIIYSDGRRERIYDFDCDLVGRELTVSDNVLNVYKTLETGKRTTSVTINVSYGYAWERAKSSDADFTYFTHYNSDDWISFGSLQLYGTANGGKFIYSENSGLEKFTNAAVVIGTYNVENGSINFVSRSIYVQGNYQSKFYINSEGDYFIAATEGLDAIVFKTGYLERNLFGHYCKEPNETSFSRYNGEVYFERVTHGLSQRAENAVSAYEKMRDDNN